MCFGRESSSCFTNDTSRVAVVTNPVMNEERARRCLRQVEHISESLLNGENVGHGLHVD